ncbi:MAG: cell division protein FtsZ [Bacilli bacterium]|jgi:cell division protein FtsZ|nr:cell division protein FtsZ [Erysipelotrichia bacterium]
MNEIDDTYRPVAKIVVIGVGGAGNNAVNRMIDEGLKDVEFYVANTDRQTLNSSKTKNRLILGYGITGGLGAGGEPSVGREAANDSIEDIRQVVKGANMVFIAAGMGGGTGTGAAPIIAQVAKEENALVVAIVTRPFTFEGKKRIAHSVEGLNELKDAVDAIIIVSNDKLLMLSGTQSILSAFAESDAVLAQSVKTVTDLILMPAIINLDFADVRNTLKDAGISLIGFGFGEGPSRAHDAAQNAINSPLLEASINGARRAICSVTCGPNVSLFEAQEAVNLVIEAAGSNIDVKFGVAINRELSDQILVSVIASDFTEEFDFTSVPDYGKEIQKMKTSGEKNSLPTPKEDTNTKQVSDEQEKQEDSILPGFLRGKNVT